MAVPAFIDSQTQDSAGATTITFDMSTITHTTDDFLIAFVKQSENTGQQTWDDDGGGGNGWTRIAYNRTTGGRDQETAVFYKFATSASESDPTFDWDSGGTNEPMSGALLVYRGVDTVEPFTEITWQWAQNDANPPNPDVRIDYANTRVVCCHNATHDDISTVAAPTGFTLRTQVWNGTADDHRNHFTADIEIDTVGTYSPPDWQHSVLNTTPEYQTYTIALNEVQPIHITGGTALDDFNWGDANLTITGDGFEATQGTGKVEFWSDTTGTVKTVQTIDSWSDTSIQIDTVQGSLNNDTTVYLVVTNDSGDESKKIAVSVGVVPYHEALLALQPDHYWRLNNTYDDTGDTGPVRNMTSAVVGTWTFNTQEIVDGNTHSLNMDGVTDRREIADSPNMNITISSAERTISFWLQLNSIQHSLAAVWKEGGGVQNLAFLVGYGNVLMWQLADVAGTRDNVQAVSDRPIPVGRPVHVVGRYSHSESPDESRLYIDGVEQSVTDGNPMTLGIFDSHSGDVVWGDPDNNLETGGTDIAYSGMEDAQISDFATWSDNSGGTNAGGLDKVTEIRDILFRRGAIPDDTIVSGTESAMQTALDATADARPDWPLSYRIEAVTGGGDFELTLNDKVFDENVSIHLEYRGSDTLTLINTGTSNIDSAKTFSPSGGTITVVNAVPVTVTVLDIVTNAAIQNARVYLEADTGGPLTAGTELLNALTDVSGQASTTLRYSSDQPITGRVRRGSSSTYYRTSGISATVGSAGLSLTVFMIADE